MYTRDVEGYVPVAAKAPIASMQIAGPGASEPSQVTHCLTVQGPQQGLAMVTGRKQIENRSWKIPFGWYALHVGSQPLKAIGSEWPERLRRSWPDAPPESALPSSKIIG